MFKTWFDFARDAVLLGFETQRVIGLRLAKMAEGDLTAAEQQVIADHRPANAGAAISAMEGARFEEFESADARLAVQRIVFKPE